MTEHECVEIWKPCEWEQTTKQEAGAGTRAWSGSPVAIECKGRKGSAVAMSIMMSSSNLKIQRNHSIPSLQTLAEKQSMRWNIPWRPATDLLSKRFSARNAASGKGCCAPLERQKFKEVQAGTHTSNETKHRVLRCTPLGPPPLSLAICSFFSSLSTNSWRTAASASCFLFSSLTTHFQDILQ